MNTFLLCQNLLTYSLQIGLLIGITAVVPTAIGLKVPRARLFYWQCVLVASLLLPLVRGWKKEVITTVPVAFTATAFPTVLAGPASAPVFSSTEAFAGVLLAGIALRLLWLGIGLLRLRRYGQNSEPLHHAFSLGDDADLRVSAEISSPVTFGFHNPVILLPASFPQLEPAVQEAILCHEMLHVRRRDWLFAMAEELVRAVFWFHPGIWWLLAEIQLTREQVVDEEVIGITRSRERYVDALLSIAGATRQMDLAPAPLFLRKRHLKQRVVSILREVRMSKTRTVSALAAGILMLAGSCWLITGALPLQAAPQMVSDAQGITVEINGAQLMHRSSINYPAEARLKGIQGTVVVQVKLDGSGNVADASVLSGPDELRKAVLESVLNWHFSSDSALSTRQISITFAAGKAGEVSGPPVPNRVVMTQLMSRSDAGAQPTVLKRILVVGLEESDKARLLARLPVHEGESVSASDVKGIAEAVHTFDEHLAFNFSTASDGGATILIRVPNSGMPQIMGGIMGMQAPPPPPPPPPPGQSIDAVYKPIRVGGNVSSHNILSQVPPVYPELAKQARVQGTVTFDATIGTDGQIKNLHLISGPPLLVQAAMMAVQQWVYRPTLLNGVPVDVITTIDVNFTLSQ